MPEPDEREQFLASLPVPVRLALKAQNAQALETALLRMPPDEAEALMRWLVAAGVVRVTDEPATRPETERPMPDLPPAVAEALASGNTDAVYAALAEMPPDQADKIFENLRQQGLL
jgi:ABC-type phosphate/phosphonate transport system substrate-binding protein